jgi:hypothetical protein
MRFRYPVTREIGATKSSGKINRTEAEDWARRRYAEMAQQAATLSSTVR